jgi:NodT family efflux transporter outer membrane factor (OMF) lipoprotein
MPQFKIIQKAIVLVFSLTVIGACTPLNTAVPEIDVPTNWQGPISKQASIWPERNWWVQFDSDELIDLVEKVEENNFDLAINTNNLRRAQLTMIGAGLDLWPTPKLSIGSSGTIAGIGSDINGSNKFSLNGSISYNNILSKYSDHQLALANYDSAQASAAGTVLSTLGTTANTYFQLLFIRDQLKTAKQNLESAQKIERIIQSKVEAGVVTPVDALQQKLAVQQRLNIIENLKQSELASKSSLALLLGRSAQNFDLEGLTLENIIVPKVQPGIPSELLVRRPDLVEAEAKLRGAQANVDLARLAFFPSISLTLSSNTAESSLTRLLQNPDPISITANLVQTIFDNGSRVRNEEQSSLVMENSLLTYRKVVLKAFNDVDVALGNIRLLDSQAKTAKKDLERATEAFRISEVLYREGVQNYQTLLSTQQVLYAVRDNNLKNKLSRLNAMVAFYQTLGGGWEKELLLVE